MGRRIDEAAELLWDNSPKYTNRSTKMEYIKVHGRFFYLVTTKKGSKHLMPSGALCRFELIEK